MPNPSFFVLKKHSKIWGGRVTAKPFTSGKGISFPDLAANLVESGPDGYFLISGPFDTAMVCQHLRKIDTTSPIFISPWAYHTELTRNGGAAVEGLLLVHSFQRDSRQPAFLEFKENFFRRFKTTPEIWETFSYEAVYVLSQALASNPDPKRLKATLLEIGRFRGLQGDILFDRYGDNRRRPKLLTVKNGAFVEIQQQKSDS